MVPALFLAHGSPMLAVENTGYTQFLAQLGQRMKPKAIVIFTAHWESDTVQIADPAGEYETIYDFAGFPDALYQVRYRAHGSPDLAARLENLFRAQGIAARRNPDRGLDHGAWTLLHRLYPQADIPVVQLSIHPFLPPAEQFRIGETLRGFGQEDILVIGSGVTVHNLRLVKWGQTETEPWAIAFDDWLIARMSERDNAALFDYAALAPYAKQAVPRPEHFVPLFIAMGSGDPDRQPEVIHRHYEFGTISYLCFQF